MKLSTNELSQLMADFGMSTHAVDEYHQLVQSTLDTVAVLDELALPDVSATNRAWQFAEESDNALGAWYVRTDIRERDEGRLAGQRIAVKDNVLLAGVPLMNGTTVLEGYVPDVDAEIVRRMLAEGATITGKTVCEAYCFSGGSHTAASGLVRNPHNPEHSAGGSSSGSGVVVANGEADMAIGCDQGGSIRMPASFCGIVGMKPTWSLVPYTGVLGMTPDIDHTGPMTRTIRDNAVLLDVLAGPDGEDSRQTDVRTDDYVGALERGAQGLRVGIMQEGFSTPFADPAVNDRVREAAAGLTAAGIQVEDVSIPMHAAAGPITFASVQRIVTNMFDLDGCPVERPDLVPPEFIEKQRTWRERADELPPNVKVFLLVASLLRKHHGYNYVARGWHHLRQLRAAYDEALEKYDALILPTTAITAHRLPGADASLAEQFEATAEPLANTGAFNSTHHPALSVPVGKLDGLPVGLMLVGRHFDEATLYRLGQEVEAQWAEASAL